MRPPPGTRRPRPLTPTAYLLMITFRAWLIEIPVAAFNAFVAKESARWRPLIKELGIRLDS